MEGIALPLPFPLTVQNIREEWQTFKQEMEFYLIATEKDKKSDYVKVSILLNCMGKDAVKLYNTFVFDPARDGMVYEKVLRKFDSYFTLKMNVPLMRYHFLTKRQKVGERFVEFAERVTKIAKLCDFGILERDMIRDILIVGTSDSTLRHQLLKEECLSLDLVIKSGKVADVMRNISNGVQQGDKYNTLPSRTSKHSSWVERKHHTLPSKKKANESNSYSSCFKCRSYTSDMDHCGSQKHTVITGRSSGLVFTDHAESDHEEIFV